jgi:DNA polymerase (family 10)
VPINNNDVAQIFNQIADLLEILNENQFRIRAYRNAARTVASLSRSVADLAAQDDGFKGMPGIGQDLADKIRTIVKTGRLPLLTELEKKVPAGLTTLMRIRGLGPRKANILYRKLKISTPEALKKAAEAGKIAKLEGFGSKTEQAILEELARTKLTEPEPQRFKLAVAEQIVEPLVAELTKVKGVERAVIAGSYRRRLETVGDADILVVASKSAAAMDRFVKHEDVEKVLAAGASKSSVVLRGGLQVDLRVVPAASFGAALVYFTGSKAHNIAIRTIAVKKKLKINEYGVFKGKRSVAGRTEAEVYDAIGLPLIPPELRENRGEIEAARKGALPRLVELKDLRGDLHSHTKTTDGRYTSAEMAQAAKERGYEYLAISDHSKHVSVARGMDAKGLARKIKEIDGLNKKLKGITLLKSVELDILADGTLDLPDDILKELDLVICSIHYNFNLPKARQTERVIKAMDNKHVNIFCHPTGRLINERPAYEIDLEKVIQAAKERGCYMELNAHPDRLDLDDVHCQMAREMGVKVAISTDAHSTADLDLIRYGIGQARRGWLEAKDVINTRGLNELRKLLKRS